MLISSHCHSTHFLLPSIFIPLMRSIFFPTIEERIRNRKRRSITSSIGDSLDEQTFIFEPIFVVCVLCVIVMCDAFVSRLE